MDFFQATRFTKNGNYYETLYPQLNQDVRPK